jgi:predicted ATPase
VRTRSLGNVFFAREFLLALKKADYFRFDQQEGRWQWDEGSLAAQQVPRELVGLLTARLEALPADTLDLLDTATCVGSEFDLATLASVHRQGRAGVAALLNPAVALGLVVPLDANHRLYAALASAGLTDAGRMPARCCRRRVTASSMMPRLSVHGTWRRRGVGAISRSGSCCSTPWTPHSGASASSRCSST